MFFQNVIDFLLILLKGVVVMIEIIVCVFVFSLVFGLIFVLLKVLCNWVVLIVGSMIVNVICGLLIIVQLFYMYFVLFDFGV